MGQKTGIILAILILIMVAAGLLSQRNLEKPSEQMQLPAEARTALYSAQYPQSYIEEQTGKALETRLRVNLANIKPGLYEQIPYLGVPVIVYRRPESEMKTLEGNPADNLLDPRDDLLGEAILSSYKTSSGYVLSRIFKTNQSAIENMPENFRSKEKEFFVFFNINPFSGCLMVRALELPQTAMLDIQNAIWVDPCTGLLYDGAGRALKQMVGQPENTLTKYNLFIPPYEFESEDVLVIGLAEGASLADLDTVPGDYEGLSAEEKLFKAVRFDDIDRVSEAFEQNVSISDEIFGAAILGSRDEIIYMLLGKGIKTKQHHIEGAKYLGRSHLIPDIQKNLDQQGTATE
jgi:hypothetical protein